MHSLKDILRPTDRPTNHSLEKFLGQSGLLSYSSFSSRSRCGCGSFSSWGGFGGSFGGFVVGSDSLLVDGFGSCFVWGVVMSWCMGCLMRSLVMWVCDLMALFVVRLSVLLIQRFEV